MVIWKIHYKWWFSMVYHLVIFHIAMENDPFMDDFPVKTTIYSGFSMAMLNNQMVYLPWNHRDMMGNGHFMR